MEKSRAEGAGTFGHKDGTPGSWAGWDLRVQERAHTRELGGPETWWHRAEPTGSWVSMEAGWDLGYRDGPPGLGGWDLGA